MLLPVLPELPELPVLPMLPELPVLPMLPELPELPVLAELPELPVLPELLELPALSLPLVLLMPLGVLLLDEVLSFILSDAHPARAIMQNAAAYLLCVVLFMFASPSINQNGQPFE